MQLQKACVLISKLRMIGTAIYNKIHTSNSSSPTRLTLQLLLMVKPFGMFEVEENEATLHFYLQQVILQLTVSGTTEPLN